MFEAATDIHFKTGYSHRWYWHNRNHKEPDDQDDEDNAKLKPLVPNIIAVSKAIYEEAASILYGQHIIIADTRALLDFAAMMTPKTAGMLRDVTIKGWCRTRSQQSINYPAMAILAVSGVVNLECLNLDCQLGYYRAAGRVAKKVYRDCYPWLHAVGNAKGDVYAALDILQVSDENFPRYVQNETESERVKYYEGEQAAFKRELKRYIARNSL